MQPLALIMMAISLVVVHRSLDHKLLYVHRLRKNSEIEDSWISASETGREPLAGLGIPVAVAQ